MDLYGVNRTSEERPLHYSPAGWQVLTRFLKDCGIETDEFTQVGESCPISAETCFRVANTIDFHWDELTGTRAWLREHAREWRRLVPRLEVADRVERGACSATALTWKQVRSMGRYW